MAGGTINLAVKTTNDSAGLKAAQSDFEAFGGKITAVSAIATGGMLALAGGAVKMAADYQQSMSQVAAVSGATGAELEKLKTLGKDIGADTAFSARDAALAMGELAAGGRSVTQILGGEARAAVDLAAAGNYGLAESGRTIATVMDVWKDSQISTNDVVNRLAGAANASRFGVEDMSQAVAQAGGVAAQMGVSFEDFTTAIAMSASSFASGSDAGTSYKTMLLNLDGTTDKAKSKIAELNLQFREQDGAIKSTRDIAQELADKVGILGEAEQTAALKVIFGNDAYRTAAAMMDGAGEAATRVNDVLSNTNAADIAATRMDNAKGSFEEFKGSAETLAISLGDKALPAMTNIADAGVAMINGFGGLPESTQQLGLGMVALATAAPAAAAGISKAAAAVKTIKETGMPAGAALSGIALGIGAVLLVADGLTKKFADKSLVDFIFGTGESNAYKNFVAGSQQIMEANNAVGKSTTELQAALQNFYEEEARAADHAATNAQKWGNNGAMLKLVAEDYGRQEERVRAVIAALEAADAPAAKWLEFYKSLSPAMQDVMDKNGTYQRILTEGAAAVQASAAADLEQIDALKSLAREYGAVADAAPPATTALQDFTAGLEEGANWADELNGRLDTLAGRFGSLDPQMAINNINLAILKEELADVTAAGGEFSERLGMTTDEMAAQIAVLDGSNAALGENEEAYRTLMGEMEKLAGPAGAVSGAVLNIDAAIQAANLSAEDQIEVAGQVGQALSALATGDIPGVVAALLTIGETSPAAMQAFVDGITDPAKKAAIISHIETIAPEVGATLRPAMKTAGEEGGAALGQGAVTGISGEEQAVFTAGVGLGGQAAAGLAAGIDNNTWMAIEAGARLAGATMAEVAALLEIMSPSRKFMEFGRLSGEGYALGLKQSEPMVAKAASEMVEAGYNEAREQERREYVEWREWRARMDRDETAADARRAGGGYGNDDVGAARLPIAPGPGGTMQPGTPPAPPKLPLQKVGQDVYWDPNTGTFVNGATNMPGTDATWNPATGELGTDAIQANGGLSVYKNSDGTWRDVITDELATNPDGTFKTARYQQDAVAYQSRAQAVKGPWITGGIHTIGGGPGENQAGATMGVTGAYMSGYMGMIQDQYNQYIKRQNELGHGALSDRFYNYGQDMSDSNYGKKTYESTGLATPGIDPWHPAAMVGGGTRYWQSKPGSAEGGEWAFAMRRQGQGGEKPPVVINVQAMDSQSFLRAMPQIREAMRQDEKRGGY